MSNLLNTALASHRSGRLDEAESLYRRLLSESPRNADALHLLGVLAHQRGQPAQAIPLIEQAIDLNPNTAVYHVNLAEAHRVAGNSTRAEAHARRAGELAPENVQAHNNLGLALAAQGRDDEAVAAFERAIALNPLVSAPYANLAQLLRQLGRPHEALAFLREGLRLIAGAAELHAQLGRVLADMGQLEDALAHCSEALRLQPNYPEGLCQLGYVQWLLRRQAEANASFQRAVSLQPALALPYQLLAQLAQAEGHPAHAVSMLRQAVQLEPHSASLHADLAAALYENEQTEEAIAEYRQAVRLGPGRPEVHNNLGYLLQDRGDMPAAVAEYREALRARPAFADAHVNLGLVLTEMGELDEAQAEFRAALRLEPQHPEALAAMALSLRDRLPEEDLAAAQAALADDTVPIRRRAVLQYGLAHYHDARKDYRRAATLLTEANRYFLEEDRQRGRVFSPAEHEAYVNRIIEVYTPAHFARTRGWGDDSDVPVFIVGLPRSGTSLLEQVLASHPQVFGGGELELARACYRALPGLVGKTAPGIECVGDLTAEGVGRLARQYLDGLRALQPTAVRIVDKMPDNYLMLGLITTMLPRARVIHIRRDLRDVALSCWMTYFRHIHWSFDPEHIAARIHAYLKLMAHWRQVLPQPMLEIDYEDMVADTEGVARQAVQWCGLDWDPACAAPHLTRRVVRTASMVQVREPVYQRAVQRWKNYQGLVGSLFDSLPGVPLEVDEQGA